MESQQPHLLEVMVKLIGNILVSTACHDGWDIFWTLYSRSEGTLPCDRSCSWWMGHAAGRAESPMGRAWAQAQAAQASSWAVATAHQQARVPLEAQAMVLEPRAQAQATAHQQARVQAPGLEPAVLVEAFPPTSQVLHAAVCKAVHPVPVTLPKDGQHCQNVQCCWLHRIVTAAQLCSAMTEKFASLGMCMSCVQGTYIVHSVSHAWS